jgi:hypothetical protein
MTGRRLHTPKPETSAIGQCQTPNQPGHNEGLQPAQAGYARKLAPLLRDVGDIEMNRSGLIPVMNNTKWDELRLAMDSLGDRPPKWRTRDVESGFIPEWDGEWSNHFRAGGYESIEWVEIQTSSPQQETAVLEELKRIHVPGVKSGAGFKVFGYVKHGQQVDYIK